MGFIRSGSNHAKSDSFDRTSKQQFGLDVNHASLNVSSTQSIDECFPPETRGQMIAMT
jgi:hypothetical protein